MRMIRSTSASAASRDTPSRGSTEIMTLVIVPPCGPPVPTRSPNTRV